MSRFWNVDGSFHQNGNFDAFDWPSPEFGYLVPALSRSATRAGDLLGVSAWGVQSILLSITLSVLGVVIAPLFVRGRAGGHAGLTHRLIICGLLVVCWRGYVLFPSVALLASLPAFAALWIGAQLSARCDRLSASRWAAAWGGVGALIGVAANIQVRYWLLLAPLGVFAWVFARHRFGSLSLAVVVGLVVVAVPQSIASARFEHSTAPWVRHTLAGNSISWQRMSESLTTQRTVDVLDAPPRVATDGNGQTVAAALARCCTSPYTGEFSVLAYARQLVLHPIAAAKMVALRSFNAADVWSSSPYPEAPRSRVTSVVNFAALLAAALTVVVWITSKRRRRLAPVATLFIASTIITTVPFLTVATRSSDFLVAVVGAYAIAAVGFVAAVRNSAVWLRSPRMTLRSAIIGLTVAVCTSAVFAVAMIHSQRVAEHLV